MAEYVSKFSGLTEEQKEAVDCVVCMRVSDLPVSHVSGSTQHDCAGCGTRVWASPNAPVKPPKYCLPCVVKMEEAEKATVQ